MLGVGGGDDGALEAHELGCLHLGDLATHDDIIIGEDDEFAVFDLKAAFARDDEILRFKMLGYVTDAVRGDLFCHGLLESEGIFFFLFFEKSHENSPF